MIYSTCRLRPLPTSSDQERKHLIRARYRQSHINYRIHKEKLSPEVLEDHPFTPNELRQDYPHIDFSLPKVIEFCSGTGEFLINLARRYSEFLFIGVEVAYPCIQRALTKIEDIPHNLLFYYGEGKDFVSHDFKEHDFSMMMVNFPDPWPKKRHIKRRIISSEFISLCKQRLTSGGSFHTATDVEPLHLYHREVIGPLLTLLPNTSKKKPVETAKDFYLTSSRYQEKNLSHSKKVFYTHHLKD